MDEKTQDTLDAFAWQPQPAAARWVGQVLDDFVARSPTIRRFAEDLLHQTGTRLVDWVREIHIAGGESRIAQIESFGFEQTRRANMPAASWHHRLGIFPTIMTVDNQPELVVIKVDSVDELLRCGTWPDLRKDEVSPPGRLRTATLSNENGIRLVAQESHGTAPSSDCAEFSLSDLAEANRQLQSFVSRVRDFPTDEAGFAATRELIASAADVLDINWTCDLFFEAERRYWMSRNHAAQVQYARQQRFGLGWGNHDHHTYRSSRACFHLLIATLEQLGFECRERFYAGEGAGWGAQVLEQPNCGLVVFADVDLSPEEITGDIAHTQLDPTAKLGTVGLWCALHGEAFLRAGMHHLECQFDFEAARKQLAAEGVETMAPFTNFPHLRQAFTVGEAWMVDPSRIDPLLTAGHITHDEAEQFKQKGTVGSHLEILERNDGFKGFNQTGVSDIIRRTDPRKW